MKYRCNTAEIPTKYQYHMSNVKYLMSDVRCQTNYKNDKLQMTNDKCQMTHGQMKYVKCRIVFSKTILKQYAMKK